MTSRKIQKVLSKREIIEEVKLTESCEEYRLTMRAEMENFPAKHIWSTDQTGVQYEMMSGRTLSFRSERMTFGFGFSPKNSATHSYTIQPIISLAGQIVGDFYVCLQETKGRLGPAVESTVFTAPNLTITCSASGKLTKSHVEYFLDKVMKPQVTAPFLLTFDHWSGQIDPSLYSSRFGTGNVPACKTVIVPEKCTSFVQALDTGFNRQLKYFIRQVYDFSALHGSEDMECRLTDRNSVLKIVSLAHFTLSAPCFKGMIRQCWVTARILPDVENTDKYVTVKDQCFLFKATSCAKEACQQKPFIRCSWCDGHLCFEHFYHDYHVMECIESPWLQPETYEKFRNAVIPDPEQEDLEVALHSPTQEDESSASTSAQEVSTVATPGSSRGSGTPVTVGPSKKSGSSRPRKE